MKYSKILFSCLVLIFAGTALSCGGVILDSIAPDLVLINGKIVTVDADFSIAEAVAISDGKFVAVGNNAEISAMVGASTEVVDLVGNTVLPGFNDGHGHVTLTWGKKVDPIETRFRNATSIEEVLDILREKMESLDEGELLWFDRGASGPDVYKEKRWPTRHDLDAVSTDRPILLSLGRAGSNAIVNTKLLRDLGIDSRTPQPRDQGMQGEIVKDSEGQPTGVFLGWAGQSLVRRGIQLYPTDVQAENILRAAEQIHKYGITSIGDPNTAVASTNDNIPMMRAYQKLAAEGRLPIRANVIPRVPFLTIPLEENLNYLDSMPVEPGFGNDFVMMRQVKVVVNSSRGSFKLPHDDVKAVFKAIHKAGWQLMVHVAGGESFDVVMEAIDEAYDDYPDGPGRHLITHAREPSEENIQIMVKRGVMVDPQPGTLWDYPDDAELPENRYGPLPLRTYLDRGVGLMISSDQQPVGPMFHIFEAVNRVRRSGNPIVPEEAITVEEAIRATTITPAYATFQEDLKGSIERNKFADLVVLGRDILTVPPMEIKDIPILHTMIDGEFVYTNKNQDPYQEVLYWDPGRSRFLDLKIPDGDSLR